jgi:hypothetical protein
MAMAYYRNDYLIYQSQIDTYLIGVHSE